MSSRTNFPTQGTHNPIVTSSSKPTFTQIEKKTLAEKVSKFAMETIPTFISDNKYAIGAVICLTALTALCIVCPYFWPVLIGTIVLGTATLISTAMQVQTWKRALDPRNNTINNDASPAPKQSNYSLPKFLDPLFNLENKDNISDTLKTYEKKQQN
jgi:hypothetical protein